MSVCTARSFLPLAKSLYFLDSGLRQLLIQHLDFTIRLIKQLHSPFISIILSFSSDSSLFLSTCSAVRYLPLFYTIFEPWNYRKSNNVRIHRMRKKRSINPLIELQISKPVKNIVNCSFNSIISQIELIGNGYLYIIKNRKAKFVHLLSRKLSLVELSMSFELLSSCLREKHQFCAPISSSQCATNLTCGDKPILMKALTFHPYPAPL